jgi:single-stranded-DNA-specific exonuclease
LEKKQGKETQNGMTHLKKNWRIKHERKSAESLWSALSKARKIEDPGAFFCEATFEDLHDPFFFDGMDSAVERILEAIAQKERIVIYGDYDVDGTSGSALLIHTLRWLGAEVSYRIPHRREDGYGLHEKYVRELLNAQVKVLITVDCGISCAKEIAMAESGGMNVIVTDHHHLPKDLPKAFALLHPQLSPDYPFHELSGSGVAFKLASALLMAEGLEDRIPLLVDLASLGTVADCVPLRGENRVLVKLGLRQMQATRWDGLRAILEQAKAWGNPLSSDTIGFQIGPRINASGRMDHPYWGLQTLISEGAEARQKSQKLEELNQERQSLTKQIHEEVEGSLDLTQPILIACGKGWPSSIVGLIAGRIQEKYGKPTLVLEDKGERLVGSARSIPGLNIVELIGKAAAHLESFGGHEQAAGFHLSAEFWPVVQSIWLESARAHFEEHPLERVVEVDTQLRGEDFNLEVCESLSGFAPHGIGNPAPLFLMENAEVLESKRIGKDQSHLKAVLSLDGQSIEAIAFGMGERLDDFSAAKEFLVQLEQNEWQGEKRVQLRVVDFR